MNKVIQSLIFVTFLLYLGKSIINKLPLIVYSETPSLPTYKVKQGSVYDGDTMRVIDNKGHDMGVADLSYERYGKGTSFQQK